MKIQKSLKLLALTLLVSGVAITSVGQMTKLPHPVTAPSSGTTCTIVYKGMTAETCKKQNGLLKQAEPQVAAPIPGATCTIGSHVYNATSAVNCRNKGGVYKTKTEIPQAVAPSSVGMCKIEGVNVTRMSLDDCKTRHGLFTAHPPVAAPKSGQTGVAQ
jgi:hypothetical protein